MNRIEQIDSYVTELFSYLDSCPYGLPVENCLWEEDVIKQIVSDVLTRKKIIVLNHNRFDYWVCWSKKTYEDLVRVLYDMSGDDNSVYEYPEEDKSGNSEPPKNIISITTKKEEFGIRLQKIYSEAHYKTETIMDGNIKLNCAEIIYKGIKNPIV